MNRVDLLSLGGIVVAIGAVLFGQHLEGGQLRALVNGPAILIVVGGSLGAAMLQSPLPVFVRAMRMLAWVFSPPQRPTASILGEIVRWSQIARREGLLGLEKVVEKVPDLYARKALQLLIDGNEPLVIRETLELDCLARERRDLSAARVIDGIGGYAPTLGILGAVMGLIQVMNNLADPSRLGEGIAVAFVATVYGVGLANLVFLPAGNKIKALVREQSRLEEMIAVGVVAIAQGDSPYVVEARLQGLAAG
ncbi:MAG: flagellar motor protein [Gammaproteobacteria bacterium]|nr:flagellar motor protein [Gammaproteobacteria bacterium]MCP5202270.1 flagellar motor protein [Gammaproteobacteria bacterium]